MLGPAALLESADRPAWWAPPWWPRRLEALIGQPNGDGSFTVRHYFCGQRRPDNPWLRGDPVSTVALGSAALGQRGRAGTPAHELVAHVPEPDGLAEYTWAVNLAQPGRWRRSTAVRPLPEVARPPWDGPEDEAEWGPGAVVAVATAHTRLRAAPVQALVQVDGSIYHLRRAAGGRWVRHACLRLDDRSEFACSLAPSRKVAQVSGDVDSQPGRASATLSSSASVSGVLGTDLGVRVDHAGRTFLLFGDTHWHGRSWLGTRDAIAEVTDPDADRPVVRFHGAPLKVRGGRTTRREYDVPLDAFSLDGRLYAFFTSDHFRGGRVMGRSVLARAGAGALAVDPGRRRTASRFDYLGTLSDWRFLNVSVQRRGDQLYLWGSGGYRADELRLARVDLTAPGVATGLHAGSGDAFLAAVEYWAGASWSPAEADARPLITPGAHGEVSVRWVPAVGRYLMLTMSGPEDPIGPAVVLRTAEHPEGPWSPRLKLLDWIADGMSHAEPANRFIKALADGSDPVGDAVFRGQANATGAAYAPYVYDARLDGDDLVMRYTLSTWNPYQVVLMRHRLPWATLLAGPSP